MQLFSKKKSSIPHLLEKYNYKTISKCVLEQKLNLWICSFGGSATNTLANYLDSKGFVVRTPIWKDCLCHFPSPLIFDTPYNLKAIYLFDNPLIALSSQKRRGKGFYKTNYLKLQNKRFGLYTDRKMLKRMVQQYHEWSSFSNPKLPILQVSYNQLFDRSDHKLSEFLGIDFSDFPEMRKRSSVESQLDVPSELLPQIHDIIQSL